MSEPEGVLARAVGILRAFTAEDSEVALAELARRTGLSKTTTHRLCRQLVEQGLLEKTDGGYRLALGLFELGLQASVERSLSEVATPFLQDLYAATNETVHLGIADGSEVIYIAKIGGHRQVAAPSRVGGRMPMHCTAIGKALLAHAGPDLQRTVLSGPLEPRTPHTVVAPGLLKRQLGRVLETGLAWENEESKLGLRCVASPVLDPEGRRAVAAISVTGPVGRFHPERHAQQVRTAAVGLSQLLARRPT